MPNDPSTPPNSVVQSVERALTILETVVLAPDGLSLAELCRELGLKKTTLYFLAETLVGRGYLTKVGRPARYVPGPACERIHGARASSGYDDCLVAELRMLAELLPHGVLSYAEPLDTQIYTEFRLEGGAQGHLERRVHRRQMPYTMATNLCIVAFWPDEVRELYLNQYPFADYGAGVWGTLEQFQEAVRQVRRQGFATVGQDRLRLAVPVFSRSGALLGSLGVAEDAARPFANRDELHLILGKASARLTEASAAGAPAPRQL